MADTTEPQPKAVVTIAVAKAAGLRTFFTGKPCKRGHVAERYVSGGGCSVCMIERVADWKAANPARRKQLEADYRARHPDLPARKAAWAERNADRLKIKAAAYYLANGDVIRARSAAWYLANKERANVRSRAYYAANKRRIKITTASYLARTREERRRRRTEHYAANAEQMRNQKRVWYAANIELGRSRSRNSKAKRRKAEGTHSMADIRALFLLQKGRCAYHRVCGNRIKLTKCGYHADHIVALKNGGTNWITNIQLTCVPCNQHKHAKDPLIFARQIGLLL